MGSQKHANLSKLDLQRFIGVRCVGVLGALLLTLHWASAQELLPLTGPLDPSLPGPSAEVQDNADLAPSSPTRAVPSPEAVQQAIEATKEDGSLDESLRNQILERYARILPAATRLAESQAEIQALESAIQSAPRRLSNLQARALQPVKAETTVSEWTSLEEIRAEQDRLRGLLRGYQGELEELATELRKRREDGQRLPERIAELQTRLQALNGDVGEETDLPEALRDVAQVERETIAADLRARLQLHRQTQIRNEAEAELLPAREALLRRQADTTEKTLTFVSRILADQRGELIRNMIREFERLANLASTELQEDAQETRELAEQWKAAVTATAELKSRLLSQENTLKELQLDKEKTESLVLAELSTRRTPSRAVGFLLQRKQAKLPLASGLNQQRTLMLEAVETAQETIARVVTRRDDLATRLTASQPDQDLLAFELDLLQRMQQDFDDYINGLVQEGVNHSTYIQIVEDFRQFISKHLLWVRSSTPYRLRDTRSIPAALHWLFGLSHLGRLGQALLDAPQLYPVRTIGWSVGIAALIFVRRRIKRELAKNGMQASHRLASAMRPTLLATVWTMLLSMPLPLILIGPGYLLHYYWQQDVYVSAIGFSLMVLAALGYPLEVVKQVSRPNGLAMAHFAWPSSVTVPIRRCLWWMLHAVLPIIFLWLVLESAENVRLDLLSLSRPLFVIAMAMMAGFLWYLSHPKFGATAAYCDSHQHGWLAQLRWLWRPLVIGIPVGLALLSVSGFNYSASQLGFRFYRTVWLITVLTLLSGLALRWLLMSRRKIAIQQLRQRAAERAAEREADREAEKNGEHPPSAANEWLPSDLEEEEEIDVSDMSAQTERLVNAILFVLFLVGLYNIWGPVLPALTFLDSKTLWSIRDASGGIIEEVTLSNLLKSIPIVVLTVIGVRNVPGLLETVLLQRLPLETAVRYAITTITSYVVAALGIITTASLLGLHWDSVQWLIAGLSVGLGFGLQEIFANFISGIILLFEQPIRVGDLITLNGESGSVIKIRMRATTIRNWDRHEIVVPNKELITGTLVNWSLSDTVNRVVINVGVAYGSDTERVTEVLREIIASHPQTMDSMPQQVLLESFGDSTLDFTVRCFLASYESRVQTLHELHMEIDRRFRAEGIEIAFPQQDVHIRDFPPNWPPALPAAPIASVPETTTDVSSDPPQEKSREGQSRNSR